MQDQALHHLMQERMQALEEALHRARWGCATEADWYRIWKECGLSDRYPVKNDRRTA